MIPILAVVTASASAAMAVAWLLAEKTGQSGWADATWSLCVGALGAAVAVWPIDGLPALASRQAIVGGIALCWGLRLAIHIAWRTNKGGEDPRYAELKRQWGDAKRSRLFWFLQIQAFVAAVLALCIGIAAHNPAPAPRLLDYIGVTLIVAAIAGESIADRQLRHFRARSTERAAVCDTGLWRFSRHPNYFFEWLTWIGYAVVAIDVDGRYAIGWLTLAAPILMYWLLVHVSGIPPLEEHMMRSRPQAFHDYRARVNAFWPGMPRIRK
jgi:steroid 5-alpha reductase family enzyme